MSESTERPRVAVVHGRDRRNNIRQAQLLLGQPYLDRLRAAAQVFIHPNLVSDRNPLACTHVEAVRAILDVLALQRGDEIQVGDASYHDTKRAWERLQYPTLARSGHVRLLDLNDDETVPGFALDANFVRQPVPVSKTVADADCIILVVPARMHSYYTVTLSVKTHVVGSMVVARSPFGIHARWPQVHSGYAPAHRTLAEGILERPAHSAFLDGREAMEGNGPASGTKVELDWAVGSLDPVAADAVAAWLMGFEVDDIGYLTYLRAAGRVVDPERMDIVGEPQWAALRRPLVRPETWPDIAAWKSRSVHG